MMFHSNALQAAKSPQLRQYITNECPHDSKLISVLLASPDTSHWDKSSLPLKYYSGAPGSSELAVYSRTGTAIFSCSPLSVG